MDEELLRKLRLCPTLPSPPATVIRIIELANDPSATLMQIADCLAHDPALAAKMLKVANSPLYNRRRMASNLRQAVNLLGTHAAISIALSFSLVRNIAGSGSAEEAFWQRSVCAALACRILAQRFGLDPDDLLLAGLIQDIGILALRTAMGEQYASLSAGLSDHDELLRAERAAFGSGHDEVGYWLLKRWNLPDYLAVSCLTSHSMQGSAEPGGLFSACVAASGYFADVFVKRTDAITTLKLGHAARRLLDLDAAAASAVVEEMRAGLSELEDLFDISVVAPGQADALVAEARELLMVANLSQLRELEERSQRDALTGVHNRAFFDRALENEFDLSVRHGWPLSVAFIDIDHFKQVNDSYGHAVGDNALISLTRVISAQVRNGDVFSRYGGEEFVLLLPGTPSAVAESVLSRIRDTVAALRHSVNDHESFKLTISVGIASRDESSAYENADALLRAADSALYAAKGSGRDQVSVASPAERS